MLTYLLCITFFLAHAIRRRKHDTKDVGNKEIKSEIFTPLYPVCFLSLSLCIACYLKKTDIIFLHHYVNFSLVLNMPYKRKTIGFVTGEMAQKKILKREMKRKSLSSNQVSWVWSLAPGDLSLTLTSQVDGWERSAQQSCHLLSTVQLWWLQQHNNK